MNRKCKYGGCRSHGGSEYMDWHEALAHGECECGWVGAVKNMPWHRGHQPERDRPAHEFVRTTGPERDR